MGKQTTSPLGGSDPAIYEQILVPAVYQMWTRFVVDEAEPNSGDKALDLACGTGIVTRLLAQKIGMMGEVTGMDNNSDMLTLARRVEARSPGSAPIDYDYGSATALPYKEERFDIITVQDGLAYFANRATAIQEMYRVMLPAGRLSIMSWREIEGSPAFYATAEVAQKYLGLDAANLIRQPFTACDADELRALMMRARFRRIEIDPVEGTAVFASVDDFVKSQVLGTGLVQYLAARGTGVGSFYADLQAALEPWTKLDGFIFPMQAYLVKALK